jgi:UDP-glucose 4-epimerase
MFEKILSWYSNAHGLRFISLRYFNAAGATKAFGENHQPETHLIPCILKNAVSQEEEIRVFGTDYPTRDGSCIRDYIHVLDIVKAHILALRNIDTTSGNKAYNLGNGRGYSVMEIIKAARKVTGAPIPVKMCPRRNGDPEVLMANPALARKCLGWEPDYPGIEDIINSAWEWQKKNPHGYGN